MEEIRQQDLRLWTREMCRPARLAFLVPVIAFFILVLRGSNDPANVIGIFLGFGIPGLAGYMWMCWSDSKKARFKNPVFADRWNGCKDRLERFEQVLKKLRKEQIADLNEMPATIRKVAQAVYIALRRADMIAQEVHDSELGLADSPSGWTNTSHDPQSQALYRLADRNVAEYRNELSMVMAGVHRAEAQSAVFMTTLDSIRMKMLGYRLVGKAPEVPSQDFLEALAEARAQLQSIDTALEELDLGHYPRNISVPSNSIPTPPSSPPGSTMPPFPEDEIRRLNRLQ